jgi:hypothetical protein
MDETETDTLMQRKAGFEDFYKQLIPALVDFVQKMGINPAHEVLNHAPNYLPFLASALRDVSVASDADRTWLLPRVAYFIGEYFVQRYGGCWYVNDIEGSRYFARYVVGRFSKLLNPSTMLDPFEAAREYVDSPPPRDLEKLTEMIDAELAKQPTG